MGLVGLVGLVGLFWLVLCDEHAVVGEVTADQVE